MGKVTGFKEIERRDNSYAPVSERIKHYREFVVPLPEDELRQQGARCMDCGIPYCHNGCPVNNLIPDWNDLVYDGNWRGALDALHATNNFPEFTGRICPAPCEASCTLNITDNPVTIKNIECAIIDQGLARAVGSSRRFRRAQAPANAWPWSAPAPPAWPAPSNWRVSATRLPFMSVKPAWAVCCAMAFPTSRWKST